MEIEPFIPLTTDQFVKVFLKYIPFTNLKYPLKFADTCKNVN